MHRDLYSDFERNAMYPDTVPEPMNPVEPEFRMVGMGAPCDLPQVKIPMVCSKCNSKMEVGGTSCGHVECPSCWGTWARRGAERISARIWGFREASRTHHKPRHATFDLQSVDWKEAKTKAEALGFTGGVIVIHPWRIKAEFRNMFEIMAERIGISRYEVVRQSEYGMAAMQYSPHAHVICYGKGVDVAAGSSEYQYRMIRRLNSPEGLQGAVYYLLSHTFIPSGPGKMSFRYFGSCLPQRLKPDWKGKHAGVLTCPDCGAEMVYPDTNICKEISVYFAEGWRIIIPKPRGTLPNLVECPGKPVEIPSGHPSFYYVGTFSTRSFV